MAFPTSLALAAGEVVNPSLAQLSNGLLYTAMVVYAGALVAFAAELAFGSRLRHAEAAEDAQAATVPTMALAVPVGVSATTTGTTTGTTGTADLVGRPRDMATNGAALTTTGSSLAETERIERVGRVGVALTVLALVAHAASVVTRGVAADRLPWGNMFEFSTAGALAVTGVFVALLASGRRVRYLGVFVVGMVLLILGLAVTVLYTQADQLIPALKSVWLGIHVTAAIISMGLFTIGFVQTILYLVQSSRERRPASGRSPSFMDRFPAADALDRAAYQMHAFVFPLWTFAIMAGAIWAENAWGRYWGWDPKEVWSFVTWVAYAGYLHARATAGWRGRKAAYLALGAYSTILFNYLVVNIWLVGFHSYAGVG